MSSSNKIAIVRQGESLPFKFDRGPESIDGWVCTIEVKKFPGDTSSLTRIIPAVGNAWPGFLTSAETALLSNGLYRLIGVLTESITGEEEQVPIRFNITDSWAT